MMSSFDYRSAFVYRPRKTRKARKREAKLFFMQKAFLPIIFKIFKTTGRFENFK
jgi:hypothetical protein